MRSLGSQSNVNNAQNARIMKSSSQVLDEVAGGAHISTGVANIPNQVHYHHSQRKININVLLFGK